MRRILGGILPLLMVLAGFLLAAGPASAASSFSQACTYGPCGGTGTMAVTSVSQTPKGVTTLNVSGSGFKPGETVDFSVGGHSVGDVVTNGAGAFSTSIVLPGGLNKGTYTLNAIGTSSGITASAPFTLAMATSGEQPCTASATSGGAAIVLAAAYSTTACLNTQAPAANTAQGVPAAAPQASKGLAFTGTDAIATATFGAVAIGLGGVLVMSSRRRKAKGLRALIRST
jgi:hypothetical protein